MLATEVLRDESEESIYEPGCADVRSTFHNAAGPGVFSLAPVPPTSTVLARPLRDVGTQRLRMMRGAAFLTAEGDHDGTCWALPEH